ncbi:MAG: hypothetical protein A4E53_01876 [Pelotomaculum sp. PtaB.Bin104]|nr:MAG: hypothetical protein A4E53_01876 [Pelotomaculum sp. PtaB.Bin104]
MFPTFGSCIELLLSTCGEDAKGPDRLILLGPLPNILYLRFLAGSAIADLYLYRIPRFLEYKKPLSAAAEELSSFYISQ